MPMASGSQSAPPKTRPAPKTYRSKYVGQDPGNRWSVSLAPICVREKVKTKVVPLPYGKELILIESSSEGEDTPSPKRRRVSRQSPVRICSPKYFKFEDEDEMSSN